jgi:hypothetical protein
MSYLNKQYYYFTFCYGDHEYRNCFIKFYGTYSEAREKMVNRFGIKWAFQYNEEEFKDQIEKFNLKEVL